MIGLLTHKGASGGREGRVSRRTSCARVIAALSALAASGSLCSAQIEWRIEQDPFAAIDRLADEPYSRDQLQNVSVDGDILEAVRLLDADDFAVREQAMAQLLKAADRRIQLYALLAVGMLSPEQRYRLLAIVRHQLLNAPRGAIGVEMEPPMFAQGGPIEIRIVDLIAGLPAERVLQVGDRIIAIDGNPLFAQDDLQSRIQAKKPGDPINITVKRPKVDDNGRVIKDADGEVEVAVMTFELQLGPAELLEKRNRQRGLNVRGNRIDNARRMEAEAITYAYAPKPRPIRIKGGTAQLTQEDEIDQTADIVNLRLQQEMLIDGNPEQLRVMQEIWRRQLADLLERSQEPGLTDEKRDHLRRVAERFMQVMNAGS